MKYLHNLFLLHPDSFLLVEGSELGCAMNVYIFVTATAESCSTWVSTIQQAKVSTTIRFYFFNTPLSLFVFVWVS